VTASEFAFLALGLVLGVASGAALSIVIRARPPGPREVRVTVSPDAVPRRSGTTLSGLGAAQRATAARGGPADPEVLGEVDDEATRSGSAAGLRPATAATAATEAGTPVRSAVRARAAVGIPISPAPDAWPEVLRLAATAVRVQARAEAGRAEAARPVRAGRHSTTLTIADVRASTVAEAGSDEVAAHAGAMDPPSAMGDTGADDPVGERAAGVAPCGEERRQAEERCALADRLREEATLAAARVSGAQRALDDHQARADAADAAADPRALLVSKESAWHRFREVNEGAHSPEMGEAAARDWLQEIDRINRAVREAAGDGRREREEANALVTVIERLSLSADAARINAESASEACDLARETLATCEESHVDRLAGRVPIEQPYQTGGEVVRPWLVGGPGLEPGELVLEQHAAERVFGDHEPAILKLLHGDQETMHRLVAALAGDDPAQRRRWQLGLSGLVDALIARAIEASALEFPQEHSFWRTFSQGQCRDIATALASLGYRFDGLGSFADGRIPSQRDLSLAVGYAGLDPMRIRHWPNEAEMRELYGDVSVAAGQYLAGTAGELTLGEMVAMLHGRAEELTIVWDSWARLRPLLLRP
jgi:hypothetical protein